MFTIHVTSKNANKIKIVPRANTFFDGERSSAAVLQITFSGGQKGWVEIGGLAKNRRSTGVKSWALNWVGLSLKWH